MPDSPTFDSWFGPAIKPAQLDEFEEYPRRPRRKIRGRRRYYRKVAAASSEICLDEESWYDFKHWHVDSRGVGNLSWRDRRSHLAALFNVYRCGVENTKHWTRRYQCWLQIEALDSSRDAVFLHTPNPNADDFPYRFEGVTWDVEIPERLREFVDGRVWEVGRADWLELGTQFMVRVREKA